WFVKGIAIIRMLLSDSGKFFFLEYLELLQPFRPCRFGVLMEHSLKGFLRYACPPMRFHFVRVFPINRNSSDFSTHNRILLCFWYIVCRLLLEQKIVLSTV